ncbi:hypothetical protein ACA910_017995 [Epithemia clementina (nom. ined.)]
MKANRPLQPPPPVPMTIKARRRSSSSILSSDRGEISVPEKASELRPRNLNVSAGGVIYEKAASRHARHRRTLMTDHSLRDSAIPLQRGGNRGPGLSELPPCPSQSSEAELEENDEALKAALGVIPDPRTILGRSQRLLQLSSAGANRRGASSSGNRSRGNVQKPSVVQSRAFRTKAKVGRVESLLSPARTTSKASLLFLSSSSSTQQPRSKALR